MPPAAEALPPTLRVRWLGRVRYRDAHALQRALFERSPDDHLLLLEHPHVYTLGVRADPSNLLLDADALRALGADVVEADRGGDVTYHGPGQLVGYPILSVAGKRGGGMADTVAYVTQVEQLVIDVLADVGLPGCGRLRGYPGVWVDPDGPRPRKVAAIGVKLSRGRSMHGFALNVDPDMAWFARMVPCGITDKGVTSLAAEGLDVSMHQVVDAVVERATALWGEGLGHPTQRTDVVWRARDDDADLSPFSRGEGPGEAVRPRRGDGKPEREGTSVRLGSRLDEAGVTEGLQISSRKPAWMRVPVRTSPEYLRLKREISSAGLVTVCEEAGCPNIWECWGEGTATFMINGERCTRACGFCLVDTRHPEPPDPDEPAKVADAVVRMGLSYVVLTTVARDDLADGGASGFVRTVEAIRAQAPRTKVELLISDCKGDPESLAAIFGARPDVLNHNVETVARLQRAVRPSAGYARSLAVLARAKDAGLVTKSGLIVGMGETHDEVVATLADLRSVGVDIVTIGQYLRPTTHHVPVARWWTPDELTSLAEAGRDLGLSHVEATPLTRSSHHAEHSYEVATAR